MLAISSSALALSKTGKAGFDLLIVQVGGSPAGSSTRDLLDQTLKGNGSGVVALHLRITELLVHGWDLARATGLDETLDGEDVHRLLFAMEPMDEVLRASGQYGPRVVVSPDADEQTRLIAFTGRRP